MICSYRIAVVGMMIVVLTSALSAQQIVVTVGNGTAVNRFPLGSIYKYECSASLLLKEEINCCGRITAVAWFPTKAQASIRQIKVYLKETDLSSLSQATWSSMVSGAALLCNSQVSVTANSWNNFVFTNPFPYKNDRNLLVLVEAYLGSTGVPDFDGGAMKSMTSASQKHEFWQSSTQLPVGLGTVDSKRANLQLTFNQAPLQITSSTAFQNMDNILSGTANQPVIGVEINAEGYCSQDGISMLTFNTNGTSNAGDILNVHVYYSGGNPEFSTSVLFGTVSGPIAGSFPVQGNQLLNEGPNYFWLTYDVAASAQTGNCIDAECTGIAMGSNIIIPSVTSPPGCLEVKGPMSGLYTINPSGQGERNYTSFSAVLKDISRRGFSDSLTFLVPAGEVFNESPLFFDVSGSPDKPVKFIKSGTGADPVINFTGTPAFNDAAITLSGCSYYNFDGIKINDAGTSQENSIEYGFLFKNNGTFGSSYNEVNNCTIDLSKSNTSSLGIYLYSNAAAASGSNSGNKFLGNSVTDCYSGYKIAGSSAADSWDMDNTIDRSQDKLSNISNLGGGPLPVFGITVSNQKRLKICNTAVTGISAGGPVYGIHAASGTGNIISIVSARLTGLNSSEYISGIFISAADSVQISACNISDITSLNKEAAGIYINTQAGINISGNCIYGVSVTSATTLAAYGIFAGSFRNALFCNNMIANIKAPQSNYSNGNAGIYLFSGTKASLLYNSVLLNYKSNTASNKSSCLYSSVNVSICLKNNIFVNNTDVTLGQTACAFWNSGSPANISMDSDNNIYYAGSPGPKNLICIMGSSSYQTLTDYQTYLKPRERLSRTENPPFNSSSGQYDLHLSAAIATFAESGAVPVQLPYPVLKDIDGEQRNSSKPDIGADEGEFKYPDNIPPVITFAPVPDSAFSLSRVINGINITDNIGIAGGNFRPKIYWKKNQENSWNGSYSLNNTNPYSFEISGSVLQPGDIISYYFTAQDLNGNVEANPNQGFSALNVNTILAHPVNPAGFNILRSRDYGGGGENEDYYYFANSVADPGAVLSRPVYNWRDPLSLGHSKISVWQDGSSDEGFISASFGFSFPFFGNLYNTCYISTNGYLSFSTPGSTAPAGMAIPSTEIPNNLIALYAMDLNMHSPADPECAVYYGGNQEEFIVTYFHAHTAQLPGYATFQAILHSDGTIILQYNIDETTMPLPDYLDKAACLGIENSFGNKGIQYRRDGNGGPVYGTSTAIAFGKDPAGLPVELSQFSAVAKSRQVILKWETKSEINSYMFEIERMHAEERSKIAPGTIYWERINKVPAAGNSSSPKYYFYQDNNLNTGEYQYRLKMTDNDGKFEYSNIVSIEVSAPAQMELDQNFPNPFNSETIINYSVPIEGKAFLVVHNILGQKVMEFPAVTHKAGYYSLSLKAEGLPSGIYFYTLMFDRKSITRKLIILR